MGYYSGGRDLLFTASEVINYMQRIVSFSGKIYKGGRFGRINQDPRIIKDLINELGKRRDEMKTREGQVLAAFGAKDVAELQKWVAEAHTIFGGFSNYALRRGGGTIQSGDISSTDKQIAEGWLEQFNTEGTEWNKLLKESGFSDAKEFISENSDTLVKLLLQKALKEDVKIEKGLGEVKGREGKTRISSFEKSLSNLITYMTKTDMKRKNAKTYKKIENGKETRPKIKVSREYKDAITTAMGINLKMEYNIGFTDLSPSMSFAPQGKKYYKMDWPYFGKKAGDPIFEDDEVWSFFKSDLSKIVGSEYQEQIEKTMEELGREFFAVSDFNGLKGRLGEMQALLILRYIYRTKKGNFMKFYSTGQIRNAEGKETPVDILIRIINKEGKEGFSGVQVKNIHNWENKEKEGYQLKMESKSLSNFDDIEGLETFCNILITRFFNQVVPDANETYRNFYSGTFGNPSTAGVQTSNVMNVANNIAAMNMFAFFGDSAQLADFKEKIKKTLDGSVRNAFYLFEGKYIVPYSKIYEVFIQKVEKFRADINNKEGEKGVIHFGGFRVTPSYESGPVWKNEYADEDKRDVTRENVLSKLQITAQLSLYLSDLVDKEILDKLAKNRYYGSSSGALYHY